MNEGNYILVNGSFLSSAEYRISLQESEGFLFSEKIRSVQTCFPFFRETLEVIKLKLMIFNQPFPELTENEGAVLKRQMERTLTKNKQFLGAILSVRFWVYEQKIQYSVQSTKSEKKGYELNIKGLYVSVFQEMRKSVSSISYSSLGSEVYWKIVRANAKDAPSDDYLLENTEDQIIETLESNVYLVKNGIIKGASIDQGAYIDITKPLMLDIFKKLKLNYTENEGISEQDLNEADEIFVVNAVDGIRWVVGFEGKRYFNQTTRKINDMFINNLPN